MFSNEAINDLLNEVDAQREELHTLNHAHTTLQKEHTAVEKKRAELLGLLFTAFQCVPPEARDGCTEFHPWLAELHRKRCEQQEG